MDDHPRRPARGAPGDEPVRHLVAAPAARSPAAEALASRSRGNSSFALACDDPRAPRPRRVLRGRRGAREPGAARQAARRRRRPAQPRRRLDRELRGAEVRHPLGDERGRGAPALPDRRLPAAAARALPAVLARRVGHDRRDRPARRAHGNRRGLPRPRHGRIRLHARTRSRVRDPDRGAREDEPDVLARRRRRRRSSARSRPIAASPAASPSSLPEPRRASSLRSPSVSSLASARAPRSGCGRAGVETIGALAALGDAELRSLLPGTVGAMLRDRARGIDPRDLDLELEPVSVSAEDTFARDLTDRERLHDEVRRLAELVSERLRNSGLSGRTVTAKLRYADFSIRTRSTTLACHRRRGRAHRPGRVRPARPRSARPSRCASARRCRRLGAVALPSADVRGVVESADARGGVLGARHGRVALGRRSARARSRPTERLDRARDGLRLGSADRRRRVRARRRRVRDRPRARVARLRGRRARLLRRRLGDRPSWRPRPQEHDRRPASSPGSANAIVLGTVLDGIPESFVLGASLVAGRRRADRRRRRRVRLERPRGAVGDDRAPRRRAGRARASSRCGRRRRRLRRRGGRRLAAPRRDREPPVGPSRPRSPRARSS